MVAMERGINVNETVENKFNRAIEQFSTLMQKLHGGHFGSKFDPLLSSIL